MEWFLTILLLIVGLALIIKCGDWFVDAASWIAKVSGIPNFIIGATIVSLGTTLPEIITSCIAAGQGSNELAIGNAVGSVNANIALIMSLSLIFMPAVISRKAFLPKSLLLIGAIGTLWAVCAPGYLMFGLAFIVLAIFALFIFENIKGAKDEAKRINEQSFEEETAKPEKYKVKDKKEVIKNIILFIIGAGGIAGGAFLLSTYGEKLALMIGSAAGVDESLMAGIVGVTIIAIGTSLPELTTTIISITKKNLDMSVGNVIGANIIDITLILPLCSIITAIKSGAETGTIAHLPVTSQSLFLDLPFCLLAACVALIPALISKKFHKWQGIVLLSGYACYIAILVLHTFGILNF